MLQQVCESIHNFFIKDPNPNNYVIEDGTILAAGKAYLVVSGGVASSRQFIGFDEGATAIKTVKGAEAENAIYNLAGQRLTKAQKGLNIVNGKVVLVK